MKKVKLGILPPGTKIRMKPGTVVLEVDKHSKHGLTRVKLADQGFWRDSKDEVYLEQ